MAISTQDINLVKRKVFAYFGGTSGNPFALLMLKAFFSWQSQQSTNPDMQFLPFSASDVVATGGKVLADAACKLYVVYAKKTATATDAYLEVFDDAAEDSTAANDRIGLPFLDISDHALFLKASGIAMANGVTAVSYTTFAGSTKSSAADAPSGFAIIGNP